MEFKAIRVNKKYNTWHQLRVHSFESKKLHIWKLALVVKLAWIRMTLSACEKEFAFHFGSCWWTLVIIGPKVFLIGYSFVNNGTPQITIKGGGLGHFCKMLLKISLSSCETFEVHWKADQ